MQFLLYLLAALLIGLNVADWRLTRACILSGRGKEGNPMLAWLMVRFGVDPVLIAKVGVIVVMALWAVLVSVHIAPLSTALSLAGLNAFYVWIVVNNWRILKS